MKEFLKHLYWFLFREHATAFYRFSYAMLIPCVLNQTFCRIWMVIVAFLAILTMEANNSHWNERKD